MRRRLLRLAVPISAVVVAGAASFSWHGDTSAQIPPVANPTPAAPGGLPTPFPTRGGGINSSTPRRPPSNVALSNGELREDVDNFVRSRPRVPDLGAQVQLARVEVIHSLPASQMEERVAALGGQIEGEAQNLVQASVPIDQLVALEHDPGVLYVRPPLRVDVPLSGAVPRTGASSPSVDRAPLASLVVGEEVAKTNAAVWHAAGFAGTGAKIGIIDFFSQAIWSNAQTAGEVPAPVGTFCQYNGSGCNVFTVYGSGQQHGTAVAEIIHEMAPNAQLYVASVGTAADLQAAVNYFSAQGVKIISRSLTSEYDGPGNGTGPIANVVDSAVAQGMTWFNAAGNTASDGSTLGQYWRGAWVDANSNGWLEFSPGDEYLGTRCSFMNGLRWSDWAANRTDYDLYVYASPGDPDTAYIDHSFNDQTTGADPVENMQICDGTTTYYLKIGLSAAGSGTAGDVLEIMTNGGALEYWQNPYSATGRWPTARVTANLPSAPSTRRWARQSRITVRKVRRTTIVRSRT